MSHVTMDRLSRRMPIQKKWFSVFSVFFWALSLSTSPCPWKKSMSFITLRPGISIFQMIFCAIFCFFGLPAGNAQDGLSEPQKDGDSKTSFAKASAKKKIVFLSGNKSHGFGSHEHYAGCRLLASDLQAAFPNIEVEVYKHRWPKDWSLISSADAIVIYSDGGKRHPSLKYREKLDKEIEKGLGVVCIHYAVEVPKGPAGDSMMNWTGGYFETHWSVNPHWVADFKELPKHPITRGVKPFKADDEWYFNMRFVGEKEGVTPILSAVPPQSTTSRKDGPHQGNPHVRKMVAEKLPQHVAWAYQRPNNKGRGFGFTGGHYHWNWGNANYRRLVLNAIAWTAEMEVPENGVGAKDKGVKVLKQDQDYGVPKKFDSMKTQKKFGIGS